MSSLTMDSNVRVAENTTAFVAENPDFERVLPYVSAECFNLYALWHGATTPDFESKRGHAFRQQDASEKFVLRICLSLSKRSPIMFQLDGRVVLVEGGTEPVAGLRTPGDAR